MLIKPTAIARTRRRLILPSALIAFVLLTAALSGCGALNLGGAKATASPPTADTTTADTTTDIYIRTDNYRVQKITAHTAGTTPSDTTLAFTAYDTGVTIDLPQV